MIFGLHIRSVVFDMDGVLWHSSAIHAAAYKVVLEQAGLTMPDYAQIAGRRTDEVMRELIVTQGGDVGMAAALTKAKQTLARQMLAEKPPVADDCVAVLAHLAHSRSLALASSASAGTVDLFLRASGTQYLFKAVVTGDDVALAKPDPGIYRIALERLGRAAGETAVVEDAPNGVRAARTAGITEVVAIEDTASAACLMSAGAGKVVRSLIELVSS